jgi:tetratricopeptide (TPR) repeat protein
LTAEGPIDLILSVDESTVRLSGDGVDVSADHQGMKPALSRTINEAWNTRAGGGKGPGGGSGTAADSQLDRAGKLLAKSFLPASVSAELAKALERAERGHQALRLGIDCDGEPSGLPWEALPDPRSGAALVLHPLTSVYRRLSGPVPGLAPSPLRILVAISSPDRGGGPLLDYERELRNVLAAVRTARQRAAHVRIVPFATTAAIRQALEADPVHVLHLSGHGSPGRFLLEDEQGDAREIDADTFVDEAVPPSAMPPVVALAACYTNVAEAIGAPSFAARLIGRGTSTVIASETSLTDVYATRVFARIYGRLADAAVPDAVAAACDARRIVQAELESASSELDRQLGELNEWAALSVIATSASIPILDPSTVTQPPPPPARSSIGEVAVRAVGDFVGRRHEQRKWPVELLADTHAGLVLHGLGGIGKTSLAAELVTRTLEREPDRTKLVLDGELSVDVLLSATVAALRQRALTDHRMEGRLAEALAAAAGSHLSWSDRLSLLRDNVLPAIPILIVLDNFEDNLVGEGTKFTMRDPNLAAMLSNWMADPSLSRFLITSRYPFSLPDSNETKLFFRSVGPLSAAETGKLVWSLPALDQLSGDEVERVWRLVGGHPRSLEYLDALLAGGAGRYPDVTKRLKHALTEKLGDEEVSALLSAERSLDEAMAKIATIAADDVLLTELIARLNETKGARELLIGMSAFRQPVGIDGILFQAGKPSHPKEPDDRIAMRRREASARAKRVLEEGGAQRDFTRLPAPLRAEFEKQMKEFESLPEIPRTVPANLDKTIGACVASGLLSRADTPGGERYFVHRWTASELERIEREAGKAAAIEAAQRKAGDYWKWRAYGAGEVRSHVDGLTEARHHYLAAGLLDPTIEMTGRASVMLHRMGAWDDKLPLVEETLDLFPPDSVEASTWTSELASIYFSQSNRAEAERLYRKALALADAHGSRSGAATCTYQLGMIVREQGELDEAEELLLRALEIDEERDNRPGIASTLNQLSQIAWKHGDEDKARALRGRATKIRKELGDDSSLATSYRYEAEEALGRGRPDEAEILLLQTLDAMEASEDQPGIAATVSSLSEVAQQLEKFDHAEEYAQRALEIDKSIGDQAGVGLVYGQLGSLALQQDDPEEAEALFERSLEIMKAIGHSFGTARAMSGLADAKIAQGEPGEAIALHGRALILWRAQHEEQAAAREIGRLREIRNVIGGGDFEDALSAAFDHTQTEEIIGALAVEPPDPA